MTGIVAISGFFAITITGIIIWNIVNKLAK